MKQQFNMDEALELVKQGARIDGKDGVLAPLIESVHRQFRKLTKTKGAFPNENSLLKLLYMGIQNAYEKLVSYNLSVINIL